MKNRLFKIFAGLMLILSIVFGTPNTSHSAYALPVDDFLSTPETSESSEDYWDGEYYDTFDEENEQKPTESDGESTTPDDTTSSDSELEDYWDGEYYDNYEGDEEDNPGTGGIYGNTDDLTVCQGESESVAWILCATMKTGGNLVDGFYELIEQFLIVEPISTDTESGIFKIWSFMRNLTNIVFIIFILIIIYSQLTGLGINNYGIKRTLPRLIIAVILVNLSYTISSIAVDISNVIGGSLTGLFESIQLDVLSDIDLAASLNVSWSDFTTYLTVGGSIAGVAVVGFGGIRAVFWAVLLGLIAAVISLGIGLATVALRQGVVLILVMISPLAFVAYLLPNTERWFEKWRNLLVQMLVFYPAFSLLFGASKLASWAIIATANGNPIEVLVGLIVQVIPIFFSFSLFKMSGNFLGAVNAGLHKLAAPAKEGIGDWAKSHEELARARYLTSNMPGAHLRRYLDKRRAHRELDTEAAGNLRKDRALEGAYRSISRDRGSDSEGYDIFGRATSSTNLHKAAAVQATQTATAKKLLENNLASYGSIYNSAAARRLGNLHAQAFLNAMKQEFRAENIAQDDQNFLLDSYLKAKTNEHRAPYEFNRLIKGASGGLGYKGEESIVGQVLIRSAEIEGRRRREATVVKNKFNLPKPEFRGMAFNKFRINDDGYEIDENGTVLEDELYRLKPELAHKHQEWPYYIGVHKETKNHITKEEYNRLSSAEREHYDKIRYMYIKDDNDNPVSTVYEDDAGYMKELLIHDINIGDPINRRYNISYGLDGPLRRYHSTIYTAMLDSKYKEHAAEANSMLLSQANMGYIQDIGQYNIAGLQSVSVAAQAGNFLKNDAYAIRHWANLLNSINETESGKTFDDYFPENDIINYRDVNGLPLKGLRKFFDEKGNPYWSEISYNDQTLTTDEKRNYIKHKIMPRAAKQLVSMLNRDISPSVLDSQKAASIQALDELLKALSIINLRDNNPDTSFDERLDPEGKMFDARDAKIFKRNVAYVQQMTEQLRNGHGDAYDMMEQVRADNHAASLYTQAMLNQARNQGGSGGNGRNGGNGGGGSNGDDATIAAFMDGLQFMMDGLRRAQASRDYNNRASDPDNILTNLKDMLINNANNSEALRENVMSYASENPLLRQYTQEVEQVFNRAFDPVRHSDTQSHIYDIAHPEETFQRASDQFESDMRSFIDTIIGSQP